MDMINTGAEMIDMITQGRKDRHDKHGQKG